MTFLRRRQVFVDSIRSYYRGYYLDYRALICFRIGLGLTVLLDLILRARDLSAHYSDVGVLPRSLLFSLKPFDWYFSLHFINGSVWFQELLFGLGMLLAILLASGVKTRLSCFLLWLFVLSLQFRNPFLAEGFDVYIRQLLFWGILVLPETKNDIFEPRRLSWATMGLIFQILFFYFFAGLHKLLNPLWLSGRALSGILAENGIYATAFGNWVSHAELLTLALNYLIVAIELLLPILFLLLPGKKQVRLSYIVIFGLFHLGIVLILDVGLFSLVSIVGLMVLLPSDIFGEAPNPNEKRMTRSTYARGAIALCVISLILIQNIFTLNQPRRVVPFPEPLLTLFLFFRFNQEWALFARGGGDEVVVEIKGWTKGNKELSLIGTSHRWRKFAINTRLENTKTFQGFTPYFCKHDIARVEFWHISTDREKNRLIFQSDCSSAFEISR